MVALVTHWLSQVSFTLFAPLKLTMAGPFQQTQIHRLQYSSLKGLSLTGVKGLVMAPVSTMKPAVSSMYMVQVQGGGLSTRPLLIVIILCISDVGPPGEVLLFSWWVFWFFRSTLFSSVFAFDNMHIGPFLVFLLSLGLTLLVP